MHLRSMDGAFCEVFHVYPANQHPSSVATQRSVLGQRRALERFSEGEKKERDFK